MTCGNYVPTMHTKVTCVSARGHAKNVCQRYPQHLQTAMVTAALASHCRRAPDMGLLDQPAFLDIVALQSKCAPPIPRPRVRQCREATMCMRHSADAATFAAFRRPSATDDLLLVRQSCDHLVRITVGLHANDQTCIVFRTRWCWLAVPMRTRGGRCSRGRRRWSGPPAGAPWSPAPCWRYISSNTSSPSKCKVRVRLQVPLVRCRPRAVTRAVAPSRSTPC